MATMTEIESPLARLTPRADRGARPRVRRDPRRGLRRARRARPPLHHEHDRDAPPARRARRASLLLASRYRPAWIAGTADAVAGQDPREHGDRPQRHARPVGLDERPRDQLLDLGLGHRLDAPRRGSTPTTTSTTRTRTSAARTATSATRSCGSTRTRSGTRSTSLQPFYNLRAGGVLRVGRRRSTTSTSRRSARARSPRQAVKRELKGMARKARQPDRQGLRRVPGAQPARDAASRRTLTANVTANIVRNVWAYAIIFCGHFPDQTYTFSRGGGRRRDARRRGTSASCSARRTSRAARSSTCISGNLGYQVEHHLFPDMPSTRYARDRPAGARRSASATGCPTTPGRSASSSARCSARSCGSPSRAASRGRSPAPTAATATGARARSWSRRRPPRPGAGGAARVGPRAADGRRPGGRAAARLTPPGPGRPASARSSRAAAGRASRSRAQPTVGCSSTKDLKSHDVTLRQRRSLSAVTVAERAVPTRRAISPKWSPGPSTRTTSPPMLTAACPSRMTKNPTPPLPSTTTCLPAGNVRSRIDFDQPRPVALGQVGEQRHLLEDGGARHFGPGHAGASKGGGGSSRRSPRRDRGEHAMPAAGAHAVGHRAGAGPSARAPPTSRAGPARAGSRKTTKRPSRVAARRGGPPTVTTGRRRPVATRTRRRPPPVGVIQPRTARRVTMTATRGRRSEKRRMGSRGSIV